MKNLKIRSRLLLGFIVTIILTAILGIFSASFLKNTDTLYSNIVVYTSGRLAAIGDVESDFILLRFYLNKAIANTGNADLVAQQKTLLDQTWTQLLEDVERYNKFLNEDPELTEAEKKTRQEKITQVSGLMEKFYNETVRDTMAFIEDNKRSEANSVIATALNSVDAISKTNNDLVKLAQTTGITNSDLATEATNRTIAVQLGLTALIALISLAIAFIISRSIVNPIKELVDAAKNIAKGKLNVNLRTNSTDEIGELTTSFAQVTNNIKGILADIDTMYHKHDDGDMDAHIDSSKYEGSYGEVSNAVNEMVVSYVDMINDLFRSLQSVTDGTFNAKLKQYKGQKAVANKEIDTLFGTIISISDEINRLASEGAKGNLSAKANASVYKGRWVELVNGIGNILTAVEKPITESLSVMVDMSKGNFTTSVNGAYNGDFGVMKDSLNSTVGSIASYINEINNVLSAVAKGDLTHDIAREYVGQFSTIKESINEISHSLNKTMVEINQSSEQVLSGAKQISESAMMLAEGATEQASAIQQLTASVDTISSQTQENADNSATANSLSQKSTENAQLAYDEMKKMLGSMDSIKEASNNISKIIKVIEDIAFQTNLLALNAAVEAARAGEHGKGFAVVAEEVRNLAGRSQTAAKETTQLIEDSIARVSEGTSIAEATSSSLDLIVENVKSVSTIITQISESSRSQSEAVSQVSIGLGQISHVIQNNSSTSEESAAAAEELNSQAEVLKQMVAYFKTK